MIVDGIPVPGENQIYLNLKEYAERTIAEGPPLLNGEDLLKRRYFLTDLVDDIREPRSRLELTASGTILYNQLADYVLRIRKAWSAKGKWIPRVLETLDPVFAGRFVRAFDSLFAGDPGEAVALTEESLSGEGGLFFEGFKMDAPEGFRLS